MEASTTTTPHRRRRRLSMLVAAIAIAPIAGCTTDAESPSTLADWCWAHYRFAPDAALAFDEGPATAGDAARWADWLDATSPAPAARRDAHRRQLELVHELEAGGAWTPDERAEYVDHGLSDPTPATVCESVGARIVVDVDGTLPPDWERRFRDPADPAWSGDASLVEVAP